MKICLMTNTYLPHVGGVARSVSTFAAEYLRLGHEVLVVAPRLPGRTSRKAEAIVERVAAIQNFNGSDFSVRLPLAATLSSRLDEFDADIVHAHHPFLLGDTALRFARNRNVPVVFTHHTKYEDYVHYLPFASPALRRAAKELPTAYANLCAGVIAPSDSIARMIKRRGVEVPVAIVPTGIDTKAFAEGDGARARRRFKLPPKAFVVGHVGRLAPEKNLPYLAEAVGTFLKQNRNAWFLVVGGGPSEEKLREIAKKHGVESRLVLAGAQTGQNLHDAYQAMDVFAFSSRSETQGLVVAEAMAAGVPVVALKASGVREVVVSGKNGWLLPPAARPAEFAAQLQRFAANPKARRQFSAAAVATADTFSRTHCAERALAFYERIRRETRRERLETARNPWLALTERIGIEWDLLSRNARAISTAMAS
jgi:glycosyltransferase involved in cell wall biosynthesis